MELKLQMEELHQGRITFSSMVPCAFPEWPVDDDRRLPTALRVGFTVNEAQWVEAGRPLSVVVQLDERLAISYADRG